MLKVAVCMATLAVGLVAACAGDDAKRVVAADGGESGEGGGAFTPGGASVRAGEGGVDGSGIAGQPSTSEGGVGQAGATAGVVGGEGGVGTTAGASNGGAPPVGEAGAGGATTDPVSFCGVDMWHAGEGFCDACPATPEVVQLQCADYVNTLISVNDDGLLYARLVPGVAVREAFPATVTVAYTDPDQSVATEAEYNPNTGGWFVDLTGAPSAPAQIVVPPFAATGACGDTYQSVDSVLFTRVAGPTLSYMQAPCP